MKLNKIFAKIDERFPFSLQESWDNSGLLVGDPSSEIKKIILGVDVTDELITLAEKNHADLIFTHHPMMFRKFSKIVFDNPQNKKLRRLIKGDISYIAGHTNVDSAKGGINDFLSDIFEPSSVKVLLPQSEKLYKLVVYVPESHSDKLKKALNDSGAASIGNYDYCFFSILGEGSFRGNDETKPYIGEPGKIESVREVRIETICRERNLNNAIKKMKDVHPYEEIAYDIFELKDSLKLDGIGRIAILDKVISFRDIFKILGKYGLIPKEYKENGKEIRRIAICSGSGGPDVARAAMRSSDLLITGELRYHDQFDMNERDVSWITLGHYESELCFVNIMEKYLKEFFDGKIIYNEGLKFEKDT